MHVVKCYVRVHRLAFKPFKAIQYYNRQHSRELTKVSVGVRNSLVREILRPLFKSPRNYGQHMLNQESDSCSRKHQQARNYCHVKTYT